MSVTHKIVLKKEAWVRLAEFECKISESSKSTTTFTEMTISRSDPKYVINIKKRKRNGYTIQEPGEIKSVYISSENTKLEIIGSIFNNYYCSITISDLYIHNMISIDIKSIREVKSVICTIYINPDMISIFTSTISSDTNPINISKHIRVLFHFLFPNNATLQVSDHLIHENFFKFVTDNNFLNNFKHSIPFISKVEESKLEIERLSVQLYPYQLRTIQWMIERELYGSTSTDSFTYFKIPISDDSYLYYDNYLAKLTFEPFEIESIDVRGGLLADEVGLGKTIEMLTLILSNPAKPPQSMFHKFFTKCCRCHQKLDNQLVNQIKLILYHLPNICLDCLNNSDTFKSPATFVVCPPSLLNQWISEISSKTISPPLNYFVFTGTANEVLHPYFLFNYDIVLATYNIFAREFYHSSSHLSESYRIAKRRAEPKFQLTKSPLTYLKFWRVVYDESQMVEGCKNGNVAQMCANILGVNKWCVTGTPIHRNLDDIIGIFSLIGYFPYSEVDVFKKVFYHDLSLNSITSLKHILRRISRRTEKSDIQHELTLPGIERVEIIINFAPIELHYYLEYQHKNSLKTNQWEEHLAQVNQQESISKKTQKTLVSQFNVLRHLCSDPFHLLAKKSRTSHNEPSVYNMQEAMAKLLEKKKTESQEHLRTLIFYQNGLAGIFALMNQHEMASDTYLSSISIYNSYKCHFIIDKLQKIHILHNYLNLSNDSDINLKNELQQTIAEYLESSGNEISTSKELIESTVSRIKTIEEFHTIEAICTDVIKSLEPISYQMVKKISNTLKKEYPGKSNFSSPFKLSSLNSYINKCFSENKNLLSSIIESIESLENCNFKRVMKVAKTCCFGVYKTMEEKTALNSIKFNPYCVFCQIEADLLKLELLLYEKSAIDAKIKDLDGMTGFRLNKDIDIILKVICHDSDPDVNKKNVKLWLKLIKECFSNVRSYFNSIRAWFVRHDEIRSCCRRIIHEDLIKECSQQINITQIHYPSVIANYKAEIETTQRGLSNCTSQLKYFNSISDSFLNQSSFNKESCPICYDELGLQWVVFLCSHFLCQTCYKKCLTVYNKWRIECPICRLSSPTDEVYLVSATDQESNPSKTDCKGSTSKITKIVSILNEILTATNDKIIVFSQWDSVLDLIKLQLDINKISTSLITSMVELKSRLPLFLQSPSNRTLLMSVELGSKGINITCANHVIFADVCLNMSDEIQAIGRCHRIGQTKTIKVYHLMMKNSIEQKIYKHRDQTEAWFSHRTRKTFTTSEAVQFLKFNQEQLNDLIQD